MSLMDIVRDIFGYNIFRYGREMMIEFIALHLIYKEYNGGVSLNDLVSQILTNKKYYAIFEVVFFTKPQSNKEQERSTKKINKRAKDMAILKEFFGGELPKGIENSEIHIDKFLKKLLHLNSKYDIPLVKLQTASGKRVHSFNSIFTQKEQVYVIIEDEGRLKYNDYWNLFFRFDDLFDLRDNFEAFLAKINRADWKKTLLKFSDSMARETHAYNFWSRLIRMVVIRLLSDNQGSFDEIQYINLIKAVGARRASRVSRLKATDIQSTTVDDETGETIVEPIQMVDHVYGTGTNRDTLPQFVFNATGRATLQRIVEEYAYYADIFKNEILLK